MRWRVNQRDVKLQPNVIAGVAKLSLNSTGPVSSPGSSACPATSPSSLPRAYLIGRPAFCCGVVLPVCPCVMSFFKFHEHDTHDLLRTSSRGCHGDAARKRVLWNFSYTRSERVVASVWAIEWIGRDVQELNWTYDLFYPKSSSCVFVDAGVVCNWCDYCGENTRRQQFSVFNAPIRRTLHVPEETDGMNGRLL